MVHMETYFTAGWVVLSMILVVVLSTRWRWNAFAALFLAALGLALATQPPEAIVETLRSGFGNTLGSIGLLVLFGTIIANALEASGATWHIAQSMLKLTGPGRLPRALALTGLIAGIPIFCDAGFIVLSGLLPALSRSSVSSTPRLVATLATALYAMHCLTPTHPGALAAAELLKVDLGSYFLVSVGVASLPALLGYVWVRWASPSAPPPDPVAVGAAAIPPAMPWRRPWMAFLPVALPLVLIGIGSSLAFFEPPSLPYWWPWLQLVGQPVTALAMGALLSLGLFFPGQPLRWNQLIEQALVKAGPILIITGAGGMYGQVIKATGLGPELGKWLASQGWGLLTPFLLAALLKTAQGSSTVAIITASAFVAPLLEQMGWVGPTDRIAVLLALAAGSMVVAHTNDSYFWVTANFGQIPASAVLRLLTPASLIMGLGGLAAAMVFKIITN